MEGDGCVGRPTGLGLGGRLHALLGSDPERAAVLRLCARASCVEMRWHWCVGLDVWKGMACGAGLCVSSVPRLPTADG